MKSYTKEELEKMDDLSLEKTAHLKLIELIEFYQGHEKFANKMFNKRNDNINLVVKVQNLIEGEKYWLLKDKENESH